MQANRADQHAADRSPHAAAGITHSSNTGVVLLEDAELYRYHIQAAPPPVKGSQQPHRTRSQDPYRVASPDLSMSEPSYPVPGSAYGFDHNATPFGLHTTPFSASMRKPSLTSLETAAYSIGAIRPGGSVDLLCRQNIGFLLNWFLVGFFNTSMQNLAYPLLDSYLGYDDTQLNAAFSMLKFSLMFKFPAGFLSDCVPINRQRRKPYMIIGWCMATVFMIIMVFHPQPDPYMRNGVVFYADAPNQGIHYVLPLMISTFANLLITVALEGMTVECAQREGEFTRGRAQSLCFIFRLMGEILGGFVIAFALNSEDYGGSFSWAVPLYGVFAFHVVLAASGVVITKLYFHEERTSISTQRVTTQLRRIWNVMQQRTTWMIMVFGFFERLGSSYEIQEARRIYFDWLGAYSLTLNLSECLASSGTLLATWLFMKYFINSNWRKMIVYSTIAGLVVMAPVGTLLVLDMLRDQAVYMVKGHVVSFCEAWLTIVRQVVIVEVAEPGYEAVTFGTFTTVFNLASMVVSMGKNIAASKADESLSNLKLDTTAVRTHVMQEFVFKYAFRLLMTLVVLPLLPRQKRHLRERRVLGNSTIVVPVVLFLIFMCLFLMSVTSNLLVLFKSTSCLVLAGGRGCEN